MSFRRLQSSVSLVHPEQHRVQRRYVTSPPQEDVSNVWIIGDSYIRRGAEEASKTMGKNLGLNCQIQWFGKGGMRWGGFLPFFQICLEGRTAPDVLVIHCGGNDLGQLKSELLITAMKRDLQHLHDRFPHMKIILSSINQRRSWRYAAPMRVEKERKLVNRVMANFVGSVEGSIIFHPEIIFHSPKLFLRDKVHLSPRGNCLFLTNIAHSLKDHVILTRVNW